MTEKNIKRLSRADLLEMLIEATEELEATNAKLVEMEAKLKEKDQQLGNRQINITNAGSIAEASLQLSGIFEAADESCRQYLDNVKRMSENFGAEEAEKMLEETRQRCAELEEETKKRCDELEAEAKEKCEKITELAKIEAAQHWSEVSSKIEALYSEYTGLRRLLAVDLSKKVSKDGYDEE